MVNTKGTGNFTRLGLLGGVILYVLCSVIVLLFKHGNSDVSEGSPYCPLYNQGQGFKLCGIYPSRLWVNLSLSTSNIFPN
jgi:hypothetical protein